MRLGTRSSGTLGWLAVAAAVAAFAVESFLALDAPAGELLPDLQVYRGATQGWLAGGSIYDYHRSNGDLFTYPPAAAVLLLWVAHGTYLLTAVLWCVVCFGALVLAGWALTRLRDPDGGLLPFGCVVLFLVLSAPNRSNVQFGQVSVVVFAVTAWGLASTRSTGGVLVGLAAALKLTPLAFVPYLWLQERRRPQAIAAAGTFAAVTAAGFVVAWSHSARYWFHDLQDQGRVVHVDIVANQSLSAFLSRCGVHLAPGEMLALAGVVYAVALGVASRSASRGDVLGGIVTMGAAAVIVSPISWAHHQYWLAAAVLLEIPGPAGRRVLWRLTVGLIMLTGPVVTATVLDVLLANTHLALAFAVLVVNAVTGGASRPAPVFREGAVSRP